MNKDILLVQLLESEALRLHPYRDSVGKLTIGIGRNLDDTGISEDEAYYLLKNDVKRAEGLLDERLPWWRELDDVRQRVLADMVFNMGIGDSKHGLLSFHNTLEAIRTGNWETAAGGMLGSKWADQVGVRAKRLAEMMRTGEDYFYSGRP